MYTIKNKPKSGKTVWDPEKGKELLKFINGQFETADIYVAKKAKELGYEVEGLEPAENPEEDPKKPDEDEEGAKVPDNPDKAGEAVKPKTTTQDKSGSRRGKTNKQVKS